MVREEVLSAEELTAASTAELKNKLLQLTEGQDTEPLNLKVRFYQNRLQPFFEELSRRNPFPTAEEQVSIVPGVWLSCWSTIPFQDSLPGRIRNQSYQIFHSDGYYANIARYAPGHQRSFGQKFSSFLLAYDFMIVQQFEARHGQWFIQNIAIEQAFRLRGMPLDVDRAENWFTQVVQSKLKDSAEAINSWQTALTRPNKLTRKKLEKISSATPQLEHLYIDNDFRLVKTQREAKQRPSYTIAVRKQ